jgi:hypothetical protein
MFIVWAPGSTAEQMDKPCEQGQEERQGEGYPTKQGFDLDHVRHAAEVSIEEFGDYDWRGCADWS